MSGRAQAGTRVAIVGAGLSGLSAARALERAGVEDLVVLEASERVGGRMRNLTVAGVAFDGGAQFVGTRQSALTALVAELGLSLLPASAEGSALELAKPGGDDGHLELRLFDERLAALVAAIDLKRPWATVGALDLDRLSVEGWARSIGVTDPEVLAYLNGLVELVIGGGLSTLSILWWAFYVRTCGGWAALLGRDDESTIAYRVDGGSEQVCRGLARPLGERLRLSSPVASIEDAGERVRVVTRDGGELSAELAIVACSPNEAAAIASRPSCPPSGRGSSAAGRSAGA